MAASAIPVGTRLTLRLNTGLDEEFNPIYRNRSWQNIKPSATMWTYWSWGRKCLICKCIPWMQFAGSMKTNLKQFKQ